MRCKRCNVEIYGKADFCPLCKQPLEGEKNEYNEEYIYPIKKKRGKSYKILTFTPMYIIVASLVFLIATTINMVLAPDMKWFWVVGIVLIYAYILVQNTILSRSTIAHKILWQGLIVFAFIWSVSHLLFQMGVISDVWFWAVDLALPIVIGVSNLVMWILTACFVKTDKSLIIDCIWFSLTGFLPIILYFANAIVYGYLAIAVAVCSLVQIIVLLIAGRKYLKKGAKLKFRA